MQVEHLRRLYFFAQGFALGPADWSHDWLASLFGAAGGWVFHAGPSAAMHWIDTRGSGAIAELHQQLVGLVSTAGVQAGDDEVRTTTGKRRGRQAERGDNCAGQGRGAD